MAKNEATTATDVIQVCYKSILKLQSNIKKWRNSDEEIIKLYRIMYTALEREIHGNLSAIKSDKNEEKIRELISKYVIGCKTTKGKMYTSAILPIRAKWLSLARETTNFNPDLYAAYNELYENYMALASYRSFEHFCKYIEMNFNISLFQDTENIFSGYWLYARKMVLDKKVKFIEKQLPTGYGKSLTDAFMQAWIFGIDIDNDVLKVCGNDNFREDCFVNVVDIMTSERYAKIFPYYRQFNCKPELMYSKKKDCKFAITGSKKSTNLRILTKLSNFNGVRAKFLMLDDITQRSDRWNIKAHNKDIDGYKNEWFQRQYSADNFYVIASGTTYSQFDILTYLKKTFGGEAGYAKKSKMNKYTRISKSDSIVKNGISAFICVPLLDYDTDESTYPKKISTISAKKQRDEDPETFWAMSQQQPLPPAENPFYYKKLRQYKELPPVGQCGRTDCCVASLDPKRRGTDNISMPIFTEFQDPDNPEITVHALKDWLYDERPMKECLPLIVSKIIQHNITKLRAERNTEECIAPLLEELLHKRGYYSCVIDDVYSTTPKDKRIMDAEGDVKARMLFPEFNTYSTANDIGKALNSLYGYSYLKKNDHDDAPDSLAIYAKKFIMNRGDIYGSVSTFRR